MHLFRVFAAGAATLFLTACGHALPKIEGFDDAAWRSDPYACQNKRAAQLPALNRYRDQLYGARIASIDNLLGRPDEEELSAQTEKTYYYYVEPGTQCEPSHQRSSANKITLRFGPLGVVTEVLYERPLAVPAS
ncbi:hypothetical protein H8B13_14555 [Hymenobacter sp. BT188]|uniref:hypothetical protein n=1 Tax=Hymenobacter sp. BT188 TaxID=2763504 RepID=UPI001651399B|nr:hypothetical protein [Hymenobacter sp. BT188]MBC6608045.1 hypothetical protein [Hymenobacter sp. BT188]